MPVSIKPNPPTITTYPLQVINQMDTSQAHLSSKGTANKEHNKPDNLSKEELTAVLKYGAQKMYDHVLMRPFIP